MAQQGISIRGPVQDTAAGQEKGQGTHDELVLLSRVNQVAHVVVLVPEDIVLPVLGTRLGVGAQQAPHLGVQPLEAAGGARDWGGGQLCGGEGSGGEGAESKSKERVWLVQGAHLSTG